MFKKYIPEYVDVENKPDWVEANTLLDCLNVLYPSGPYEICKSDKQEESVIEIARGHKFFISSFTKFGNVSRGYLVEFIPGESMRLKGFTDFDEKSTALWNAAKETWEITRGIPELPL